MSNNNQLLHEYLTGTYTGDEDGYIDCFGLSKGQSASSYFQSYPSFWGLELSGIKNYGVVGTNEQMPDYFFNGTKIKNGIIDDSFFKNCCTFTSLGTASFDGRTIQNLKIINLPSISANVNFINSGLQYLTEIEELRMPDVNFTSNLEINETANGPLRIFECNKPYSIYFGSKYSPTEKFIVHDVPEMSTNQQCLKNWNENCILEIHGTGSIMNPRSGGFGSYHPNSMTIKVPASKLSEYQTAWASYSWVHFETLEES